MLQPRIPFRWCLQSCQNLRPFLRTYATAQKTLPRPNRTALRTTKTKVKVSKDEVAIKRDPNVSRWVSGKTMSSRHWKRMVHPYLWKGKPYRPLTFPKKGQSRGGRNNTGKITVRHRGGGHKRRIRTVDFYRNEPGKQLVERIEYDPNRTAHLALLKNLETGQITYIIAAEGMRAGDHVESFRQGIPDELMQKMGGNIDPGMLAAMTAFTGNCLPIHMVPIGSQIYNIGHKIGGKAVFCRSAGTFGTVVTKEEVEGEIMHVVVRLQSGEERRVSAEAPATMGVASNTNQNKESLGKAGRKRWLGIRPTVRGVAMNAADHPHGGGRGKTKGNKIPQSPWGVQAKSGYKTRKKRNEHKFLVKERPRNQGKRRTSKR